MKRIGIVLLILCLTGAAEGQAIKSTSAAPSISVTKSYLEQKLGERLPADAQFLDERGQAVQLQRYLGQTPLLLVMGYYTCPALCPIAFGHLTEELNGIAPVPGRDFQVLFISIDSHDTPAVASRQKAAYLRVYKGGSRSDGFHFLTGDSKAISKVAQAVGFHYVFDPAQQQYIHPTGVIVATPAGRLTHYFFGIDTAPADLEAALQDAGAGRASPVADPEQQYCASYDPTTTGRGKMIIHIINSGCVLWAGALLSYVGWKLARDPQRRLPVKAFTRRKES